jgi:hypothetical protein
MSFPAVAKPDAQQEQSLKATTTYFRDGVVVTYPLPLPRPLQKAELTTLNAVALSESPRLGWKGSLGIYHHVCTLINEDTKLRIQVTEDICCREVLEDHLRTFNCLGVIVMDEPIIGRPVRFFYHPRVDGVVRRDPYLLRHFGLGVVIGRGEYEKKRRQAG